MIIRNATINTLYLHGFWDNVSNFGAGTIEERTGDKGSKIFKNKSRIPCQVVPSSPVAPSFSKTGAPIQKQGCEILVEARHLEEMKNVDKPCPFQIYYTLDGTAQDVSAQCIAIEYLRAVSQYKLTCIQEGVY